MRCVGAKHKGYGAVLKKIKKKEQMSQKDDFGYARENHSLKFYAESVGVQNTSKTWPIKRRLADWTTGLTSR